MLAYVGTYTKSGGKGIYCLELDLSTGQLARPRVAAEVTNPSFLAVHPTGRFLYAVGELDNFRGRKAGAVSAFAIDADTRSLSLVNQQPSGGAGPCFVAIDPAGRNALVANYSGGTVSVLPIDAWGRLGEPSQIIQHAGTGFLAKYQVGPHAHSINLDPAGRFALAADLGLDKVFVYRYDAAAGRLDSGPAVAPPPAELAPGSGPRHLAFHPNGRLVYVINELASTVTAFAYDATTGRLTQLQTISTLPADAPARFRTIEGNSTAEVQVHPAGGFLYGSNRGHDSIAIFAIDRHSGKLASVGHHPTAGRTPRHFAIDPTGAYLLAANMDSDSVVAFRVDPTTGALSATGAAVTIPMPVCVKFLR